MFMLLYLLLFIINNPLVFAFEYTENHAQTQVYFYIYDIFLFEVISLLFSIRVILRLLRCVMRMRNAAVDAARLLDSSKLILKRSAARLKRICEILRQRRRRRRRQSCMQNRQQTETSSTAA